MLSLRQDVRRWAPQVVHAHENHDPRMLALTSGYATVLTVHDPLGHPGAPELTRAEDWVFRRWFTRAQRFVVHGQALVDELAPIVGGRQRIVVIPHGTFARAEPLPPPEARTVLLFGRLEEYKGIEVLVEAMRLVWERRPDALLTVAGSGPAANLVPADPRITLLARYIPESEIEKLLSDASLVALPYTQASQSGVGLLAIAAGVPVVVAIRRAPGTGLRPVLRRRGRSAGGPGGGDHQPPGRRGRRENVCARARAISLLMGAHRELTTRLYDELVGDSRLYQDRATSPPEPDTPDMP